MFDYDLSPLDARACEWVHNHLQEEHPDWYRSVVEEVELGKDVFWIRTLMIERTDDHELARHCATTARWLYYQKQIDQLAAESYMTSRQKRRRRR